MNLTLQPHLSGETIYDNCDYLKSPNLTIISRTIQGFLA